MKIYDRRTNLRRLTKVKIGLRTLYLLGFLIGSLEGKGRKEGDPVVPPPVSGLPFICKGS